MKPMEYGNMISEIERLRRKVKRLLKIGNRMADDICIPKEIKREWRKAVRT